MRNWKDLECVKEIANRIEGWLSDSEGEFLYKSARGVSGRGVIVGIGSFKGKSTIWLAKGSKDGDRAKVYAIDPHTGSSEHRKRGDVWTFDHFRENLEMAGVDDIVGSRG
jgi:predicted O-methyltransferase YrrM